MNKLLNKKRYIIKALWAITAVTSILFGMDGIQGKGAWLVYAAPSYPETVDEGDEISIIERKTCVIFGFYDDVTRNAVAEYNGGAIGENSISYRFFDTVGADTIVKAPDNSAGMGNVQKWKKVADTTKTIGDEEHTVIGYAAMIPMTIVYDSGNSPADDSEETLISTNSSSGTNVPIYLKDKDDYSVERYELTGWKDTSGNEYDPGEAVSINYSPNGTMTFTAQWRRWVDVYYRPNGGTGSVIHDKSYFTGRPDFMSTVLLDSADFTREGYGLAGWTPSDGESTATGPVYGLGDTYSHGSGVGSLTFDAVWERLPEVDLDIQYKPNGGTGDVVSQSKKVDLSEEDGSGRITLLDKADFKKSGYTLSGWTDGDKTYKLGDTYEFFVDYDELSKSLTFDAVWTEKTKGTVDISIKKPAYVGAEIKYDIEKNSKGDVKVEYKKKGAKDDDYSKKAPTEPGNYTARAILEETDEYTSAEDTTDFELVYLDAPESPFTYTEIKNSAGTVTDLNVIPASGYSIGLTGAADASFGSSVLYSKAKEAGGVYLKRDKDDAVTEQVQLTAYTVSDKPSITVTPASAASATSAASGKIYYGTQYNVTVTSLSPAEKTITYKKAGTGGTYSAVMPTAPGTYTVRVTATATDYYAAVDKTADFTIEYLEAPANVVELKGTPGTGGWYKSDVTLEAPAGYRISTSADGTFGESIKWNDGITEIYYQRTSDNAKTNAVQVSFNVKIDKDMPTAVFDSSLGISGKEKSLNVYADSLTFKISDDNLRSVKVNGDLYNVTGKEWTVELKSGLLSETNTIVAADEAGNEYTLEVTLSPAWRQSMEVPMGREVCLLAGEGYKLSSKCKLEDKTKDTTVYAKGVTVYVRKDETCSFTEVDGE